MNVNLTERQAFVLKGLIGYKIEVTRRSHRSFSYITGVVTSITDKNVWMGQRRIPLNKIANITVLTAVVL